MRFKFYFLLIATMLLTSCNEELDLQGNSANSQSISLSPDEYISIAYDDQTALTPSEAKQLVLDFGLVDPQTRSNKNIEVTAISTYSVTDGANATTRSASTTIPVYRMEISTDAGKGLAYVPADKRVAKVIAYLPKVDLNDSLKSIGAKAMLSLSERSIIEEIKHCNKVKDELRTKTLNKIAKQLAIENVNFDEIKDKIVINDEVTSRAKPENPTGNPVGCAGFFCIDTEWNQDAPYNGLLQKANCDLYNTGKPSFEAVPAGCAVVAIAQIMASLEPSLTIEGTKIDWKVLKAQKQIFPSFSWGDSSPEATRIMVAKLMKYIYEGTGTTPVLNDKGYVTGSGTYSSNTANFLNRFFNTSGVKKGWDGNAAFQSLQLAKLVWIGVGSDRGGRHAFVLDGFAYWRPKTRELVKNFDFYFRANMGWGGYYDGFYLVNKDLSISFDTSNGSYYVDYQMIYNIR
ncbi:C10 family peptidase [Bacteroides acidifaciens]|uniref:C10 family peptidase n=1 Tax=Bacteroides acidifaciens TaxID=85831 RepID=UPI00214A7C94|nr:C10 family peptidase [Bacteroides acidifaciens]MCR2007638.1 C10 family peptidase [Bacteroides acidifaciens]